MSELKTRSRYQVIDDDTLESLFSISDEDAGLFVDNLMGEIAHIASDDKESFVRKIVEGKPDAVVRPEDLASHVSGFIRIFCGWHNSDYVWHIEHASIRRRWKVREEKVIYLIAKTMHDLLPTATEARIWLPQHDWDLRTFTFKALKVADDWSFHESDVEAINARLFEILNPLV